MPRITWVLTASVALVGLAAAVWLGYRRPLPPDPTEAQRPIEVVREEFAPATTCRSCHPHYYETWHASYHRTMTQVVKPGTVLADFDDVELHAKGARYKLSRRDDEFRVDVESTGAERDRRQASRRVVLSTGSHHQQLYWVATGLGRSLGLLPFAYLLEDRRWVPLEAIFMRPPGPERRSMVGEWNNNCIRCHATEAVPKLAASDDDATDTHVLEFGISCAECHGAAAEHVRAHRDPIRRYRQRWSDKPDATVVQPENLSRRRMSQVCGQCHSVSLRDPGELAHWNQRGFRFRPGADLHDTQTVVQRGERSATREQVMQWQPHFLHTKFGPDGMVRVSGREYNALLLTPCFQRGEMSCLSCHTMHKPASDPRPLSEWANDQLRAGMRTNAACGECHAKFAESKQLVQHTHHKPESTGSLCYNCHMPYTTWGLLKAIRSHQIDSPSVQASLATGRPNACNQCHLDKTLSWTADSLEVWYEIEAPHLSSEQDSISAAVLWLAQGDAGQRALVAWSMGWDAALEASGEEWTVPFLAQLLDDPYDAVRYAAFKSLRRRPRFLALDYDYVGPEETRRQHVQRIMTSWRDAFDANAARNGALLLNGAGFDASAFQHLLLQRDGKTVILAE
jgi:hypothetical protein